MKKPEAGRRLYAHLKELFGLQGRTVSKLTLIIKANDIARIEIEEYVTIEGSKEYLLTPAGEPFKRVQMYELRPINQGGPNNENDQDGGREDQKDSDGVA